MLSFFKKLFSAKSEETTAPYKIEAVVKSVADVNKDGKVDLADAKVVVHKVAKHVAKKTAPARPRKPRAPKA